MISDVENVRKMVELLGDEGFVEALTNAEQLVDDVDETLGRVEQVEGEAETAVREANEALNAVDSRLQRFDEAIRLIEAKIEAGFSAGFFVFALQQWTAGAVFLAAGLFVMGLLGISSLVVTVATMPQIQRLQQVGGFLTSRLDPDDDGNGSDTEESKPRIEWRTADQHRDRQTDESSPDKQDGEGRRRRGDDHRESGTDRQRGRTTGDSRRGRRSRRDRTEAPERTDTETDRER